MVSSFEEAPTLVCLCTTDSGQETQDASPREPRQGQRNEFRSPDSRVFPYASLESAAVFPSSDHPVICCKNSYVRACMLNHFSHVLLFLTPWTVAHQVALSMGFPWQECWTRLPFPSPGYLPNPGIEPVSPALQADSLPSEPHSKHHHLEMVCSLERWNERGDPGLKLKWNCTRINILNI